MDKAIIEKINLEAPENQGIFIEPSGVPVSIKEPVVYMRWETGGMTGGSYHEDSCLRPYATDSKPPFKVLDLVLKELKPNISYLDYKRVEELITDGYSDTESDDYYGNSTDYDVQFIILSKLENLISLMD